jgi:uncharacterized RDD family membrane protein YckC
MLTPDEFWSVASQVVSERGHLVIGFSEGSDQPELGSELDNVLGFKPQKSAMIVGQSDWDDWKEQCETFYRVRPGWGRGSSGDPNGRYYRVKIIGAEVPKSSPVPSFCGTVETQYELKGVSFWPRAVARIFDYAFLNLLVARLAGWLFRFVLTTAAGGRPPAWVLIRLSQHRFPLFFMSFGGYFAYQTICTTVYGSSVGKSLLSLQVVQDDASACRLRSAIIRELGFFVDSFFFGIIGYTAMQGNDQHRRHGDWWANTIVRKIPKEQRGDRQLALRFLLGLTFGVMASIVFLISGWVVAMLY